MTSYQQHVTPELAERLLLKNPNFRRVDHRHVHKLAKDMTAGRWHDTGDTLKLDVDGNLLDGQHRLHAIIQSGVAQDMLIVDGLDPAASQAMDIGKPRYVADSLRARGFHNPRGLQGALRLFWSWRAGIFGSPVAPPSNADLLRLVDEHPALAEMVELVRPVTGKPLYVQPSTGAVARYAFSTIDVGVANEYFGRLASGANLPEEHPIFVLRRSLLNSPKVRANYEQLALLVKTWNAIRDERQITMLAWRRDEDFPKLPGWIW